MPPASWALPSPPSAPPLLRVRAAHEGMPPPPPFPVRGTPFARKGGARGHVAPGPSSPCMRGKGARDPPAFPSPFAQRGAHVGTPHHSASAPPPPLHVCPAAAAASLLSVPIRAEWGRARARRAERGYATLRPHPSPFARKGGARGHTAPPLRIASTLPSGWRRPVRAGHARARDPGSILPHSRGRVCMRACRPAPFAREGAHEAKPSLPPHVSRSRAGTVSVRPCSSRPHPVLAHHSTS
ncbi:hypothetical protein EDB83DRAFT_2531646 [Lactarius deliciosus]|nr:hypothetical protein EDB83DRAFT_2531646 [Lactarius deliciosus]